VYDQYLTEPRLVIHESRIILAGKLKELNDTVVSMHFEPTIDDDGNLRLEIARMLAGKLPLPRGVFGEYRERVTESLGRRLPMWQQLANVDASGANDYAVKTAMGKMLLRALSDEPTEATIFLPATQSGRVPVHVRDVKIEDDTLTLTVEPLNAAERSTLLARLREPYGTETALTQ
jgi:hypothetical protein